MAVILEGILVVLSEGLAIGSLTAARHVWELLLRRVLLEAGHGRVHRFGLRLELHGTSLRIDHCG